MTISNPFKPAHFVCDITFNEVDGGLWVSAGLYRRWLREETRIDRQTYHRTRHERKDAKILGRKLRRLLSHMKQA